MTVVDTIPIIFHAGSYGTYLEWVLTTLSSDDDVVAPFDFNGNSHKFIGNHLLNIEGWNSYINSSLRTQFVRFHPKTKKEDSVGDILDSILLQCKKIIYLYPDQNSQLLVINNYFTKVWSNWWHHQLNADISEKIWDNWPVEPGTAIDQIPIWIRREFLSLYLMPAWHDQVEWYHPDRWQHSNSLVVTVSELLYNLESSLIKIQKFCNLKFKKNISTILPYHQIMLELQQNLLEDQICNRIVQYTINDLNFDWPELPLPSQSWVQWDLRNQGFELRCRGLDKFPNNSVQLKKLIYPI